MNQFLKKTLGPRGVRFLRRCLHRTVPDLADYRTRLRGKNALEIGGPSELFFDDGSFPVYSVLSNVDNCLFSDRTIWTGDVQQGRSFQYHPAKSPGRQYFVDGTDLQQVPDSSYEVVLASHCLEHMANPLRALAEWKRVLSDNGLFLLILPHKDGTFDWRRPVTAMEHMIQDYQSHVEEDDMTHVFEVLALHDLQRDPAAGSQDQFRQRCLENKRTRALHHHVFDTRTAANLVDYAGFQLIHIAAVKPFHIVILAAACGSRPENSELLGTASELLTKSPFPSDRMRTAQVRAA
jgi:SAM-dependent methyltransferase